MVLKSMARRKYTTALVNFSRRANVLCLKRKQICDTTYEMGDTQYILVDNKIVRVEAH